MDHSNPLQKIFLVVAIVSLLAFAFTQTLLADAFTIVFAGGIGIWMVNVLLFGPH